MSKVGIIANPASGKDIRRLVSQATTISNTEKTDIVKRVILGVDAVGVDEILIMPDYYGLGVRALDALNHRSLSSKAGFLEFEIQGNQEDSIRAAHLMKEAGVDCIITLGGDGTNRVVSKTCGTVPLIPISTGTNNVFSIMTEGTTAGMAAAIVAGRIVDEKKIIRRAKKITLLRKGEEVDIALVDAAVVTESFIGARALWDMERVHRLFLTRAEPGSIGLSSIGGALRPVGNEDPFGLLIELGPGGEKVKAPIAPGLIVDVEVRSCRLLKPREKIPLSLFPSIIALDGERELEVNAPEPLELVLSLEGPRVVSIPGVLREASEKGFFRTDGKWKKGESQEFKSS
jgi:predicted polyphosphate/ATP-dependent NAD kinase